jgi:hypothetical protein
VIDNAFFARETRDEYKELIAGEGEGRYGVVLVVFRVSEERLWGRIEGRGRRGNVERGGEGISVGRGTLRGWVEGFEWQVGEGELVLFVE